VSLERVNAEAGASGRERPAIDKYI
jgi:hypothetical protein